MVTISNNKTKIEWLDSVPSSWRISPLRALLRERNEKNRDLLFDNILSVMRGVGVIRYEDKGNIGNKSSDRPENYKIVRKKDIVLNSMNLSIGSLGIANEDGVTSSVYIIYHPVSKEVNIEYYHYLFQTVPFQKHLASFGRGIMSLRESVKEIDIRRQVVPVPPFETQKKIVDFLNIKTKVIDELITKKEKLIELLREKRKALITHAVTRGLNSNAQKKSLEMEWFKYIPETWKLDKFKRIAFFQEGPGLRNWQFTVEGIRVICVTNITPPNIDFTKMEKFISEEEYQDLYRHFTVKKGDLLLASSGASWGKVSEYTSEETVILNTSTIRLNELCHTKVIKDYIKWILQAEYISEQLELLLTGSCQPNFGPSHLARLVCVYPIDIKEQKQIADYLNREVGRLDDAITQIESQIEKIKEYRSTVIYEVVTGKINI